MKKIRFLLMAMLSSWLIACGMQGDLYLPNEKKSGEKEKPLNKHAENKRTSRIILKVTYKT